MKQTTLTQRVFLIALVALAPMAAILGHSLYSLRRSHEMAVHAEALRTARFVALEMDQIVNGAATLLRAIATAPVVERADGPACSDYVARIVARLPEFRSIAVLDREGVVRCMSESPEDVLLGDRDYFLEAVRSGQPVVGEFTLGEPSGQAVLPIAAPMTEQGDWSGGVLIAALDLGWLGERIRNRDFAPQSSLTVADRRGRILAREPSPEDFVGTVIIDAYQRLVRAEAPGTEEVTSQDGTRRVIGYVPAGPASRGLYVSAGFSTESTFGPLDRATTRAALTALATLVVSLALAASTSAALIQRPFRRILATVAAWRGGDETARTGMSPRRGELGAVGEAIDEFMDELVRVRVLRRKSEQQRELLLGELDHRVKNLFATVQAVARQTFRGGGDPAAVDAFLDRLRTMSGAHGLLMQNEWQQATMRDVVESAVAPFAGSGPSQFRVEGPPLALNPQAVLSLSMALHELCTNAVKYGALSVDEGQVEILWSVGGAPAPETFTLTWREHGGPPVTPPAKTGFGTRVIEHALGRQLRGETGMTFEKTGAVFVVTAPVSEIAPPAFAPPPGVPPAPAERTRTEPVLRQREA